jgi:hypothetical protein
VPVKYSVGALSPFGKMALDALFSAVLITICFYY